MPKIPIAAALCLALAFFRTATISAAELYSSGDTVLRWDNTLTYTAAFRVRNRNPALLADRNADDGDRNFAPGLLNNRFDLLSQLDFSNSWFGAHVSGAAWYDTVYRQNNDNDSAATFNPISVPHNAFTRDVQDLHGTRAELVDAFLYANTELAGIPLSVRLGRHTLLWGESLFFPDNGIAAGQAPIDVTKVLGSPSGYARDAFMPVAQASASVQLPQGVAVEAYYQFEWRATRLPGSGSYFSFGDYFDAGGERFFLRSGQTLFRERDITPPNSGQYGVALRWSSGDVDYGLYGLRFNAKDPKIYYRSGIAASGAPPAIIDPSIVDLGIGKAGTYNLVYPEGIEIYGVSASGYIGNSNIAGEISARRNMPLANMRIFLLPGQIADSNKNPAYPIGDTLHAQISTITTFARSPIWDSATFSAEIAATNRIAVTRNAAEIDPESNKVSAEFRGSFEPAYFEVLPNLDITLSFGLSYMAGTSSISTYQNRGAGNLDIGVKGSYRTGWGASLTFSRFLGDPERQPLADRDFVRFTIQKTF